MVWWAPYLNKGPRPDVNNELEVTWIVAAVWTPCRFFETDLYHGPSLSHSNPVSDGVYICSGLLLMVSWQVPYLPKGRRPDLDDGLGGDSNSGPVLIPRRLFESDSNNGLSLGHSNLVSDEVISVQVSNL